MVALQFQTLMDLDLSFPRQLQTKGIGASFKN